jgi:hypothetical protein
MVNLFGKVRINTNLQDPISHAFAEPFVCRVKRGETIKFTANDTNVSLLIPGARAFFETDNYYWEEDLKPKQEIETPKVRSTLKFGDELEYYIFCHQINKFAWQPYCSPPKIKIEG